LVPNQKNPNFEDDDTKAKAVSDEDRGATNLAFEPNEA
jgi:hypothetical protein